MGEGRGGEGRGGEQGLLSNLYLTVTNSQFGSETIHLPVEVGGGGGGSK